MNEVDIAITRAQELLNNGVPEQYMVHVTEFNKLVSQDLLRAAYGEVDKLLRLPDWQPSAQLSGAIKRLQIVF
jgi:hypothetical protein